MSSPGSEDYSRTPPLTIWDLFQLMLVVGLFSSLARPMLGTGTSTVVAFSCILVADLGVLFLIMLWNRRCALAAQRLAGTFVCAVAISPEQIQNRRLAYYITLIASFPYQAVLLTFAANFFSLGPVVVGAVMLVHLSVAGATLHYWRLARWRGANLCDNGILLHGSRFLSWRVLESYRYSDLRERLVVYERSRMRFRYHDFRVRPEHAPAALELVSGFLPKTP